MPQVYITLRMSLRCLDCTARWPVSGLTPSLASVPAITARSRQLTRIEHCWKYRSRASSTLASIMPKLSIRWAIARLRCPVVRSDMNTDMSMFTRWPT
ncbi:hypothetical protein D3C72_2084370 [compost metagenome]